MDAEVKAKWVEALRSGDYQQKQHGMFARWGDKRYCCLGVLCTLQDPSIEERLRSDSDLGGNAVPPLRLRAGLTDEEINILVDANDTHDWTFEDIAAYVEAML